MTILSDMTGKDRVAIAHKIECSVQTVRRWEKDPESVNAATRYAIAAAIEKLEEEQGTGA